MNPQYARIDGDPDPDTTSAAQAKRKLAPTPQSYFVKQCRVSPAKHPAEPSLSYRSSAMETSPGS